MVLLYPGDVVTPKRRYVLSGGNLVIQSENYPDLLKTINNCYKVLIIC